MDLKCIVIGLSKSSAIFMMRLPWPKDKEHWIFTLRTQNTNEIPQPK